jgi:hypothetical protein
MTSETQAAPASRGLDSFFRYVSPILAILTFAWGIYTYRITTELQLQKTEAEAVRSAETRRIEASKPFLEKQLKLFTEATSVTAKIATSDNQDEINTARKRFFELYWGELGLVERGDVAGAMIAFKEALDAGKPQLVLQPVALRLAHACRVELAAAWETDAWKR